MTKTAAEQVLDIIDERLRNIRVDFGYSTNIGRVDRQRKKPYQNGDLPACNYYPRLQDFGVDSYGHDITTLKLVVEIADTVDPQKSLADTSANLTADVISAINRRPENPTVADVVDCDFGGQVQSVSVASTEYVIGEGGSPWAGAIIDINIQWFADNSDPYTLN